MKLWDPVCPPSFPPGQGPQLQLNASSPGGFIGIRTSCPTPLFTCNHPSRNSPEILLQVQLLTAKGAIYPVPDQPAFISPIFLVPKSTGDWRLILDFSSLNSFMKTPKFWMTDHASLADLPSPPAWMASLDLWDAYLLIPIRPNLHKFLAFRTESQLWFFKFCPLVFRQPQHYSPEFSGTPLQSSEPEECMFSLI